MHWSILINGWNSQTSIMRAVYVATQVFLLKLCKKRTKQNVLIKYNIEWMSLLLKKKKKSVLQCIQLCCTLSLLKMSWRGGRGIGDCWYTDGIMYRFTVIMHLSSHSTDGRKGGRAANDRHNIEKIHPFEFEHPLLWNQCYVTLLEKDREMEMSVCAYRYEFCKCRTKCSTNKSLLGSSCTGFSEGGGRLV